MPLRGGREAPLKRSLAHATSIPVAALVLTACAGTEAEPAPTVTTTETVTAAPSPTRPATDYEVWPSTLQFKEYLTAAGIDCPNSMPSDSIMAETLECEDDHEIALMAYFSQDDADGFSGISSQVNHYHGEGYYLIVDDLWFIRATDGDAIQAVHEALDGAGELLDP